MTFDWERQPTSVPADLVEYAKLMGYSAISPLTLKWDFANYADPVSGYDSENVDNANYWVTGEHGTHVAPPPAVTGKKSVHYNYLTATKNSGINYIPRFEYGGSYDLPSSAYTINAAGTTAVPDRYDTWGANLLNTATFSDLKLFIDSLVQPYAAGNPQFTGVLWRIRCDRMQVSYGKPDVDLFCSETDTTEPTGDTNAQLAVWASSGTVGTAYSSWWQGKRRDFHKQLESLLASYRPATPLTLYYYNWDEDKFSLGEPDLNSAEFDSKASPSAYTADANARKGYTWTGTYLPIFQTGYFDKSFASVVPLRTDTNWPDYALQPSLYKTSDCAGIQLLAPVNSVCYANISDYFTYFQTYDGLAVSNCVSYDEIASREPNPKYEGNMVLPGGGPFSMAIELLSYFYGDARTLTYTVYTYGRGFADAHRRFAQAFRALPAVAATSTANPTADSVVRTYATTNGTYVGVAYKGYTGSTITVTVPGATGKAVTNLVTDAGVSATNGSSDLTFLVTSGPMELNAFLVK